MELKADSCNRRLSLTMIFILMDLLTDHEKKHQIIQNIATLKTSWNIDFQTKEYIVSHTLFM